VQKLSPAQRTGLRYTLRFRNRPLTVWAQVAASRQMYAIFFVIFSAFAYALYIYGDPNVAGIIGAFFAGAIIRDFAWFRQRKIGWPLTCAIIDWQRVEQLVTSDKPMPEDDHHSNPLLDS
jgi:hypothetical protein